MLAVSLRAVVMNANHAAVIIGEHVLRFGLEGPSRLSPISAELGKGRLAALAVAGLRDFGLTMRNRLRWGPIESGLIRTH